MYNHVYIFIIFYSWVYTVKRGVLICVDVYV